MVGDRQHMIKKMQIDSQNLGTAPPTPDSQQGSGVNDSDPPPRFFAYRKSKRTGASPRVAGPIKQEYRTFDSRGSLASRPCTLPSHTVAVSDGTLQITGRGREETTIIHMHADYTTLPYRTSLILGSVFVRNMSNIRKQILFR